MTSFQFRLQRVLDLRRMELQLAESECQRTAKQIQDLKARETALAARKMETRKLFAHLPEVTGIELAPLPGWYRWTVSESSHLVRLENAAAQELQKKRAALIEVQRKVRLLEKLRDRRLAEWRADFDRELEELAADATNSRYVRMGRSFT